MCLARIRGGQKDMRKNKSDMLLVKKIDYSTSTICKPKKLSIHRETLRQLQASDLRAAIGGNAAGGNSCDGGHSCAI
jgi:hypothetical protein